MKPIGAPVIVGAAWLPPGCCTWAPGGNFTCTTLATLAGPAQINPDNHTIYASGASNYVIQINSIKHEDP